MKRQKRKNVEEMEMKVKYEEDKREKGIQVRDDMLAKLNVEKADLEKNLGIDTIK